MLVSSRGGLFDLAKALSPSGESYAWAHVMLDVEVAGRYRLLLGADDGHRLFVDDKSVASARGKYREDGHLYTLDLSKGSHALTVKLYQREGGWLFRTRLLREDFGPIGDELRVRIPGAGPAEQETIERALSQVTFSRSVDADGYQPMLRIEFPDGVPLARPIHLTARVDGYPELPLGLMPERGVWSGWLPRAPGDALEDKPHPVEVQVGARKVPLTVELARASRAAIAATRAPLRGALPETEATLELWRERLIEHVNRGDPDLAAQQREAEELRSAWTDAAAGRDPFAARTGPQRRAYRSPVDGRPSEFGLYVPPSFKPEGTRKYPLIVALHGLNGKPMAMLRWFFGGDDPGRDQEWEDRHVDALPYLDAFVITPDAHGNAFFRTLGEDDVLRIVQWAKRTYPIDPRRVSITGPSMGGIGTAAIAFRYPEVFAAAAPLCGYHSYFIRGDVGPYTLRPWERFLAEERSNVMWAENGRALPLYIVHGTRDLPEANSGVLIDRYTALGFSVKHEHPDLGHNVWQKTYEEMKGARWLTSYAQRLPKDQRFRTTSARNGVGAYVTIESLMRSGAWASVDTHLDKGGRVRLKTENVAELQIHQGLPNERDDGALEVTLDGTSLRFGAGPRWAYRDDTGWHSSQARTATTSPAGVKRGRTTGPIRDAFREPLVFVYGTQVAGLRAVSEAVARSFAQMRGGTHVNFPVMSDEQYLKERGPAAAEPLFLVGTAASNKVLASLAGLPFSVEDNAIVAAGNTTRATGSGIGATFTFPNPRAPDVPLVVVTGTDAEGIFRALSLPDLLPDFVIYDEALAASRGETVLANGKVRAAGFFSRTWQLPALGDLSKRAE
jgi:poly(3-hydroxybutyrate) depolymerase